MESELIGQKYSLELTKEAFHLVLSNFDAYKETAKNIVNFGSILFSLIGLANIIGDMISSCELIMCGILYLLIFSVTVFVIKPVFLHFPVKQNWETLDSCFFGKDEKECIELLISSYLNAIEINRTIEERIKKLVVAVQALFLVLAATTIYSIVW